MNSRIYEVFENKTMTSQTDSTIIWLTWEKQIRNRSMSTGIGAQLVEMIYPGRLNRYICCLLATLQVIMKEKPRVVVGQNPSVVLSLFLLLLRPLFRFIFVSDAHFGGIHPFNRKQWLQAVLDYINRKADLVIVTNNNHGRYVNKLGGRSYVCQDPLPQTRQVDPPTGIKLDKSLFLICAFAVDEPYMKVFKAMETLSRKGYHLYVSGNYAKVGLDPAQYPGVTLLGFVDAECYWSYLTHCSVVIDLTEWDDCLVCGAYEALAQGQPLVLSDTSALRDYFGQGATYTTHQPAAIAAAIEFADENRERLSEQAGYWREENWSYMTDNLKQLRKKILALSDRH